MAPRQRVCFSGMFGIRRVLGGMVLPAVLAVGCGDGTEPAREPVEIEISRPALALEIGDTVQLRAEARDANGDPIANASIGWATLDPGLVTLSPRAPAVQVQALHAGTARVTATAGGLVDTAVVSIPPALIATTLSVQLDTLESLGDTLIAEVSSQDPGATRLGVYSVIVRNPAVAQALLDGPVLTIVATTPGSTYVTVLERHGTRDSALVVVRQREAITELTPPVAGNYVGTTQQLAAAVKDARGNVIPGVSVTFRSFDTTIVTVSATGLLSFWKGGTTAVEARGAGGSADTATVAVPQTSALYFSQAAESTGTGLLSATNWVAVTGVGGSSPWAQLRLVDTSIAQVPDSVVFANGGTFQIAGKKVGTTKLVATSPFLVPDTMTVVVSPAQLRLNDFDYPAMPPRFVPLGSQGRLIVVAQDAFGKRGDPAGQVAITIVARDTSVVSLPQNAEPYILRLTNQGDQLFPVVPKDTGRTWVVATAAGFLDDSIEYIVTSLPKLLFTQGSIHMVGAMQRSTDGAGISTTQGWDHGGAFPITFTHSHAEISTFPDSLTLPGNALAWPIRYTGHTPGADTIVASAAGYEPDTTVLYVTTPHFILDQDTVRATILGGGAYFYVGDSLGVRHATDSALRVFAASSDTAITGSGSTQVPENWPALWGVGVPARDTGTVTLTLSDSSGRYVPESMTLHIGIDTSYNFLVYDGYELGPPAPHQHFDQGRVALYIPLSPPPGRVVYLRSTHPGIVRVADSMVVEGSGFVYVPIVAGDSVGSARLIASAPRFRSDTSASLVVAQGVLKVTVPESVYVGYAGYSVYGAAWQGGCFSMMLLDTAATFTLVPLDPGITVDTALTIAAGQICSPQRPITFTTPGTVRLALEDHRNVPAPYRGDTATIVVRRPRLLFQWPYPPNVGVGQRLAIPIFRDGNAQDQVTLSLTHSSAHSVTTLGSMNSGVFQTAVWVDGATTGRDTLIVNAPGYDGDTLPVIVTDGKVTVYNWDTQIKQGDSAAIALFVGDSTGLQHPVVDSTTFTLAAEGGVTFRKASQTISTVMVPAGQDGTNIFYIKAVGPPGTARVRFVNLHYIDQVFTLTITP